MIQNNRKGEWFELTTLPQWENYTLQEIFRIVWQAPKKQVHTMRMEKKVKVNNEEANWTKKLKKNDIIQIHFFSDKEFPVQPTYFHLSVLYEDDHLIVVNKPSHMDTHPNTLNENDTLLNAVAYHLQTNGEYREIKHIHRLDRDTTGAVLFAKHPFIGAILDHMLEKREIKRTYLAIVHGILKNKNGTIHEPIGRDRHHPTRRRVSPTGQNAITHYHVLKADSKKNLSIVKCSLDTGRTHQIRVHFSHIGHPLAGDILYGGKPIFPRQALHAVKLEFTHPFTKETISCHAPFLDEQEIFPNIDPYQI